MITTGACETISWARHPWHLVSLSPRKGMTSSLRWQRQVRWKRQKDKKDRKTNKDKKTKRQKRQKDKQTKVSAAEEKLPCPLSEVETNWNWFNSSATTNCAHCSIKIPLEGKIQDRRGQVTQYVLGKLVICTVILVKCWPEYIYSQMYCVDSTTGEAALE